MSEDPSDAEVLASKDRVTLAILIDTLTEICFDGADYDGASIQDDLIRLGILERVEFDPVKHEDPEGIFEPGDPYCEYTPYGRGLIHLANKTRTDRSAT